MARAVYISASEDTDRARELGLTLLVDPEASNAHVYLQGAGESVRLDEPTTKAAVTAALQPILDAEAAADADQNARLANRHQLEAKAEQALTTNQAFLALASPTAAQTLAQVQTLTKECNALIRIILNQVDSTAGA